MLNIAFCVVCHKAESHYSESHYGECRYAECGGVAITGYTKKFNNGYYYDTHQSVIIVIVTSRNLY
jgi:hypothetical protein